MKKILNAREKQSRSEKRKQSMLRVGATDLYQTYIHNHFNVLDEISLLAKKNVLLGKLKEMAVKAKEQQDFIAVGETRIGNNAKSEINPISFLKRMMEQAKSKSNKKR
jgi:hypothetical protein